MRSAATQFDISAASGGCEITIKREMAQVQSHCYLAAPPLD
jgi:hypothetical protein